MTANLLPLPTQSSLLGMYLPFSPGSLSPQFFPWIQKALNSDSESQTFPVTLVLAVTPVTSHLSVVLPLVTSLRLGLSSFEAKRRLPLISSLSFVRLGAFLPHLPYSPSPLEQRGSLFGSPFLNTSWPLLSGTLAI